MSSEVVFGVNGKIHRLNNADPEQTILNYVRSNGLTGTKLGCGEGGCGACTVVLEDIDPQTKALRHRTVNSCITPICGADGYNIITVEGVGSSQNMHPCQKMLADAHGSQCGFCTPGFVMSMYSLLQEKPEPTALDIEHAFDGNLCRCTGYRPILDGFRTFAKDFAASPRVTVPPPLPFPTELVDRKPPTLLIQGERVQWHRPTTLDEFLAIRRQFPDCRIVGGNSELEIDRKFRRAMYPHLVTTTHVPEFYTIEEDEERGLVFGSGVSVSLLLSTLYRAVAKYPEEKTRFFVAMLKQIRWFAGKQIRNTAAIGGNLATASPISDLNPLWMAFGSEIVVLSATTKKTRVIPAKDFFIGYRKTALVEDEIIYTINLPFSKPNEYAAAFKQSRRREDDIAIVNAGMRVAFAKSADGSKVTIQDAAFAFGGMAPRSVNAPKAVAAIIGKEWNADTVRSAFAALAEDLPLPAGSPGGMIEFRRTLTASFLYKFFLQATVEASPAFFNNGEAPSAVKEEEISGSIGNHDRPETQSVVEFGKRPAPSTCPSTFFSNDLGGGAGGGLASPYSPHTHHEKQHYAHTFSAGSTSSVQTSVVEGQHATVGKGLKHLSADLQVTGEAHYTDDIPCPPRTLAGGLVMSTIPHGKILSINTTEALTMPGVVGFLGPDDIPGSRYFGSIVQDEEVLASKTVHHVGQVIGVIVAQTPAQARRAAACVVVEFEKLPAILTIEEALNAKSFFDGEAFLEKGSVDAVFDKAAKGDSSIRVVENTVRVGGQEHFYLETQASLCIPQEAGEMTIWASTQNPTKTQNVVASVLGVNKNKIVVKVKRMGGGFGGKETRSVFLTCVVALAAQKFKAPVKISLERDEDMCISGQRHSFLGKYRVAADVATGKLLAVDLEMYNNAGCFMDLSRPILDRAVFHSDGAYHCDNMRVRARCCKTNIPPNTAFRGFGGPQGTMIAENYMDHVSRDLGLSPEQVRLTNLYSEGQKTHFGQVIEDCHIRPMWDQMLKTSDFANRRDEIDVFNKNNRWRKRGISITPVKFGMSFTATFMNAASALVHVQTDGSVLVSHGGTEMGQGLHTKICQIAAEALGVDVSVVHIKETATDVCANTHPTAASASADLNGMAVLDACKQIRDRMTPVFKEKPSISFGDAALECWFRRIDLSAHGYYRTPNIGWDWETKKGRPFHYFSFGVACTEVEVDILTGDHTVLRCDLLHDVGHSLNPAIDIGQIEGAFVQGYGLFVLEELVWLPSGNLFTRGPSTYKIPSCNDIPIDFRTALFESEGTRGRTVFSSKGVGEPPLLLASSVVFALKDALASSRENEGISGPFRLDCPATCERIRMAAPDEMTKQFAPDVNFAPSGFW